MTQEIDFNPTSTTGTDIDIDDLEVRDLVRCDPDHVRDDDIKEADDGWCYGVVLPDVHGNPKTRGNGGWVKIRGHHHRNPSSIWDYFQISETELVDRSGDHNFNPDVHAEP